MDQRLSCIFRMIRPGRGVIDVGTDHGYLPLRLAESAYPGQILASDIREGPLAAAKRTASQSEAGGRIRFLLSDGLEACPPNEVDTIVIAGMGGDTICGILDRAEWCMDPAYRLILQPMTKQEVLRYWLSNNGFSIDEEHLIEDKDAIYQILGANFTNHNELLSDAELRIGKRGLAETKAYRRLIGQELRRLARKSEGLSGAPDADRRRELVHVLALLEEFRELEKDFDDQGI